MKSTQDKTMHTAYVLWLFLGTFGAHRMYLQRVLSGIFLAVVNVFGICMLLISVVQDSQEYFLVGGTCVLAVATWCLLDAFFIPGMVRDINAPDQSPSFVSLGAVNLDPSFSATMARAGRNEPEQPKTVPQRKRIPDAYEMPWRKEEQAPEIVRYRTSGTMQDRDET